VERVTSKDGTAIAYDRQGTGPAVILVGGGLDDGSENAPLATALAERFTVCNYARRGRGASGDTPPYAVERELEQLSPALAADRRGAALELFMRVAGSSDEGIASAKRSPMWPGLESIAHTLAYDAACLGDGRPPAARLARITQPTLVVTGGGAEFFDQAADAVMANLPNAERLILGGQSHVADPAAVAPVLGRFFGG
jgi:pimeloyl-ACP methyl ester carboxylesterase